MGQCFRCFGIFFSPKQVLRTVAFNPFLLLQVTTGTTPCPKGGSVFFFYIKKMFWAFTQLRTIALNPDATLHTIDQSHQELSRCCRPDPLGALLARPPQEVHRRLRSRGAEPFLPDHVHVQIRRVKVFFSFRSSLSRDLSTGSWSGSSTR